MNLCELCEDQAKKSLNGKPHEYLVKIGTCRIFTGKKPRGFEEQDYQCVACKAKFTQSSNKNDLPWTLWHG